MNNSLSRRWVVALAAIIINLCLGSIYSWSVFAAQLKVENPGWTMTQISAIFSITVFSYAVASIFAGMVQDKIGPRWVATFGGLMMGIGIIMTSQAATVAQIYLWHGLVAGIGIGSAYVAPLAAVLKWYPDKRGLVSGVVMGVFGAGGLVFGPLASLIIVRTGLAGNAFWILGIVYLIAVTGCAQFLNNPPPEMVFKLPEQNSKNLPQSAVNYTPGEMLKEGSFYIAWMVFVLGAISGLTFMSNAQEVAQVFLGLGIAAAVSVIGIVSIFNALGSPVFGIISDWRGRKFALILLLLLCGLALFILPLTHSYIPFVLTASIVILCYGGLFGIFPTISADFYGTKHLGINYGLLFLGYGVAAIVGPRMAASFVDTAQSQAVGAVLESQAANLALVSGYSRAFWVAGVGCLVAALLSAFIKPPRQKDSDRTN